MMNNTDEHFLTFEADEAHNFLDTKNIPRTKVDINGKFTDERGKYYILPLIDRIVLYSNQEIKAAFAEHNSF